VQTARAAGNGEGGPKRAWNPATRNRNHRGDSPRSAPPGAGGFADLRQLPLDDVDLGPRRRTGTRRSGIPRGNVPRRSGAAERGRPDSRRPRLRGRTERGSSSDARRADNRTARRSLRSDGIAHHTLRSAVERDRWPGTPRAGRIFGSGRSGGPGVRRGRRPSGRTTPSTSDRSSESGFGRGWRPGEGESVGPHGGTIRSGLPDGWEPTGEPSVDRNRGDQRTFRKKTTDSSAVGQGGTERRHGHGTKDTPPPGGRPARRSRSSVRPA
jgi:hypothetical protein